MISYIILTYIDILAPISMIKSLLRPKIIHAADTHSISSLERKIESATEGLSSNCFNFLHNKVLPANK